MTTYEDFYNRVGSQIGWDFSSLQVTSEGETWDLYQEVSGYAKSDSKLLDLGTGGGEKVLKIANHFQEVIGIDSSPEMIRTASKNLAGTKLKNTRFLVMNNTQVQFPDNYFDVISCRHSDFNAKEVFRLLKDNGVFLTQQVSEGDKLNIKQHFSRGQYVDRKEGTLLKAYVKDLREAGFSKVTWDEYNATEYYQRVDDLIFLLTHTPIIVDFGKQAHDLEKLKQFVQVNQTPKGIKTNSKRFKIVAPK